MFFAILDTGLYGPFGGKDDNYRQIVRQTLAETIHICCRAALRSAFFATRPFMRSHDGGLLLSP